MDRSLWLVIPRMPGQGRASSASSSSSTQKEAENRLIVTGE
jgi:hypothetical protein